MLKSAIESDCASIIVYQKFIKECKTKIYDADLVLHEHHIIPKSLWLEEFGDVNGPDNLVMLSVEDHAKAHFLHGISYDVDTFEHVKNMRSSRILLSKSIRDKDSMKIISESYLGNKNPFYGKTHSDETKKNLSIKTKERLTDVSYIELYGEDRQAEEKEKRAVGVKKSWENLSDEKRKARIAKTQATRTLNGSGVGGNNPFATPITVDGVYYGSIADAVRILNKSKFLLFRKHVVVKLNKQIKTK